MSTGEQRMNADRLFETSEAVLQAVSETLTAIAGKKRRAPYPPSLMGSQREPACLSTFSKSEVEQATAFLCRLGYLELPA
ncbi:MAG: hypothetical protein AB7G11_00550 [Phycisphaerales bacterium]